jgi:hypothetical protein
VQFHPSSPLVRLRTIRTRPRAFTRMCPGSNKLTLSSKKRKTVVNRRGIQPVRQQLRAFRSGRSPSDVHQAPEHHPHIMRSRARSAVRTPVHNHATRARSTPSHNGTYASVHPLNSVRSTARSLRRTISSGVFRSDCRIRAVRGRLPSHILIAAPGRSLVGPIRTGQTSSLGYSNCSAARSRCAASGDAFDPYPSIGSQSLMIGRTSAVPPRWSLDDSRGTIQIYEGSIRSSGS